MWPINSSGPNEVKKTVFHSAKGTSASRTGFYNYARNAYHLMIGIKITDYEEL